MKKILISTLAAALIVGISTSAFAGSCPLNMKQVDAALAAGPQLSSAQMTQVVELRAKGEADHKSGKHAASVKALHEAMVILGISQ
ncbi:MAG: hypothetical protein H8E30_04730 [Alphaproteobacteria bacterium]|nr:hypothetical protein [Alphaproteobacteria bacterium]